MRWPASVTGSEQDIDGAGRTDAGVHASGQVIAFTYAGRLTVTDLGRALDALLPRDVTVRDVRRAPDGFDPRYAARYREYRYTVWNGPRSPLTSAWRSGCGTHSTPPRWSGPGRPSSAGTTSGPSGRRAERRSGPSWRSGSGGQGRLVTIDVRADAFLRGMVRRMVACLIEVGLGRMDETAVRAALAGPGPALDGAAAPAKGLCLRRVALGRTPR